jgi:hypothetical protein
MTGLLTLRILALQQKIIRRLRKPNPAHGIATNHSRFNPSWTLRFPCLPVKN